MPTKLFNTRLECVRPSLSVTDTHSRGLASLRFIVIAAAVTFVLLLVVAATLRQVAQRDESQRVRTPRAQSPFDGNRAFKTLEDVVGFGPRPPGSKAQLGVREYIAEELHKAGLEVRRQAFNAATPEGNIAMENIYGVIRGNRSGIIILSNHYDTKYLPNLNFVGANDGGSTTAWMLEMARALGPVRTGRSIWLVFFDGEEAFKDWTDTDSLYGSRAFAQWLGQEGQLENVHALINVDMIGDCYLGILQDKDAPVWLATPVWAKASELGYESHFLQKSAVVADDHIPFRRAGVPAMNLIDFSYGGTILDHQKNWHTAEDTIDRCCAGSLQVVGDVIYHALPVIEGQLDARGRD